MTKYLLEDGIHLQDLGTTTLRQHFIKFVNNYLFSNFDDRFWLNQSHKRNDFDSDTDGLINLRKTYQNNGLIDYIKINSLREKIVSLREILSKASIDILCADETKLDASFPKYQFKISGCQFPPITRDRNSKEEVKIVFFCEGFVVKQIKNFETENAENIWLELVIPKKKWCILFPYQPPGTNKTLFFNEIYVTLNKLLGNYDNILLAGDLNTDELKTGSDSSNHLSDTKDVFSLPSLVKKPTCFKSQEGILIDLMLTNRQRSFFNKSKW